MAYTRKTKDIYEIQGYYALGFEAVCTEETYKEAQKRIKEYRENERNTVFRIHKTRERL